MSSQFISTYQHHTRNPTQSQTYTVNFYNTRITTVVTSTPAVARNWVYNLRKNHRNSIAKSTLAVGLGVQWRPTFGQYFPIAATLQLCVGSDCLIFQLRHANSVPATLRRLLEDDRVTFVGVHNRRDKSLLEETRVQLTVRNVVDLAKAEGFRKRSMEGICSDVLGFHGIAKPRRIGSCNWDKFWLSVNQVQYACVDAHVAYLLAIELGYPKFKYHKSCNHNDDEESNARCYYNVWYGTIGGHSNRDDCDSSD